VLALRRGLPVNVDNHSTKRSESVRFLACQRVKGLVRCLKRKVDILVGVREADAALLRRHGKVINALLDQRATITSVEGKIVARHKFPPIYRRSIHKVYTMGAADP